MAQVSDRFSGAQMADPIGANKICGELAQGPKDKIFPEDKRYELPRPKIKDTGGTAEIFAPK